MELTCAVSAVIITVTVVLLYHYLSRSRNYWQKRGIPVPDGNVLFFGHFWPAFSLKKALITLFKDIHHSSAGNSMVGIFSMGTPILLIRDPDLIKTILQAGFYNFSHPQEDNSKSDSLLRQNPFVLTGQAWKDARSLFVSAVTTKRLKKFSLILRDVCVKFANHLNNQVKQDSAVDIEVQDAFEKVIIEITANAILSVEERSFDKNAPDVFRNMMKYIFEPSILQSVKTAVFFFVPVLSKFVENGFIPQWVNKRFTNIVDDLIKERDNTANQKDDLLQHLIDYCREKNMTRKTIICDTFSFFFESYKTSSLTLTFLARDLALHSDVQEKVRAEVISVLNKFGGEISYEAINEMTYLDQVVSESTRLNPVGGTLNKFCPQAIELVGSDGLRCKLKPGDGVTISVAGIQTDPLYWEKPDEFRPERFDKESEEYQRRHRYVYLPFGEGPRMCPGMRLALLQIKFIIVAIVKNFVIEKSPKLKEPVTIDPLDFFPTIKGGVWIRLRRLS